MTAETLVVLHAKARHELPTVQRSGLEMIDVQSALEGTGVLFGFDPRGGSLTLTYGQREVVLYARKSLASVTGDLRLLSGPVVLEEGHWYVPVDSLERLLSPLLGEPVALRAGQHVLVLGNVHLPKMSVGTQVGADMVRVILQATEKVPFEVTQEQGRVLVRVQAEVLDVDFDQERVPGGIVDGVEFVGGSENLFVIRTGPRFDQFRAVEADNPPRLVLEFQAAAGATPTPGSDQAAASSGGGSAVAPHESSARVKEGWGLRSVVIDPGHGGDEVGAQGPSGTLEKDVVLSIARKLRSAIVNRLGIQAFLTRNDDEYVALDDRAAIANNYKADVFISIHANASRSRGAHGSEVYFLSYQASDDDARRVALAEGRVELPQPEPGIGDGVRSDLAMVLWDMAQAQYLEESSMLASRIQEELGSLDGGAGRGVKQAPFRVLVGAAMPAVLVEVGFISNPEEEKLLNSDEFQSQVVTAIVQGVARYQQERARRLGTLDQPWHHGS